LDVYVPVNSAGVGLGGLQSPQGITFGPGPVVGGNNFLFVVSKTTNSVMRYSAVPGDPQASTGNTGATFVTAASGGLANPQALLVNSASGNLLVSSFNNNSVLQYDPFTGAFIGTFIGAGSGGLNGPSGMAIHPSSTSLFVSSQANSEVLRYDAVSGSFVSVFVGSGQGGLVSPTDVAFGPGNNLYVTSFATNQVMRYDGGTGANNPGTGNPGAVFATGSGLTGPRALTFSPDNARLFVTSFNSATNTSQILVFDANAGGFQSVFASNATSPLNDPRGLFVDQASNSLFVTNSNNEILRYDLTTGAYKEMIVPVGGITANAAGWNGAAGIVINPADGMLYVNSTNTNSVLRYASTPAMINGTLTGGGGANFTAPGGGAAPIILMDNHTDAAGNARVGIGVRGGANLGIYTGFPFVDVGTTFDDHVPTNITDPVAAAPYAETFQSEYLQLSLLVGQTAAQLNGTWTLEVTDERPQSAPMTLVNWTLNFTSGMQFGTDKLVAGGAISPAPLIGRANSVGSTIASVNFTPVNPYPDHTNTPVSPDRGIGPAPTLAADDTLGSFSPYQGRIYIVYVGQGSATPDDTDVFLSVSDDGGISWSKSPIRVNDDSPFDNFSQGNRPQLEPRVAVDQATGTLVITFYDTRNDAAHDRVATYIATSLDGGTTFAPETFLNTPQTATDAITQATIQLEPIPDNQSAGNAGRDTVFGFGDHQGLAVSNGNIYALWAGNLNSPGLDILTAKATIAAGPRILSGSEGPVQNLPSIATTFAADGTEIPNGFEVQFDRPVDPATFVPADVQVTFRNTTTPAGSPPISLTPLSVTPLDSGIFGPSQAGGATRFLVKFDPTRALTLGGTYTGTYSYAVGSTIRDRVRSINLSIGPSSSIGPITVSPNLRVPPQDTGGDGPPGFPYTPSSPTFPFGFDTRDTTFSPITVSGVPANQLITSVTATLDIQHTFDSDLLIDLISPDGTIVVLSNKEPRPDLGNDQGFINTTFDDSATRSIRSGADPFPGSYRPETPLGQFTGKVPNGIWYLAVDDTSQADIGTLISWTLNISTGVAALAPVSGNTMDQDGNAVRAENPGDLFIMPTPLNGIPFQLPYDQNTLPIIVPGPHIVSTFVPGEPVTVDQNGTPVANIQNLVTNTTVNSIDIVFDRNMDPTTVTPASILRIIGPIGVIPGPFSISADPNPNYPRLINGVVTSTADPDPAHPRTYKITFPTQQLSGTYTVVLAPVMHAVPQGTQSVGDLLDTNQNAGLDVLRGVSPTNATLTPITHTYSGPPITLTPGKTTAIPLNFGPENFTIQGVTLTLNITYPFDPDLIATLVAPDGTPVVLFTKVGGGPGTNHANFTNTTFDDNGTTPIQNGSAPFNSTLVGSFNPQSPLSVLVGKASAGVYTLFIQNTASSVTGTHTLNSWSLNLLERVPGTGLGEPVADQATVHFRIFTMNPQNVLSHTVWTAVGPASITGNLSANSNSGLTTAIAVDPSDPSGNTVYVGGASGGIWKTTNFLTTDPNGPTYVPLTDFGPSFAINIGSLAVFGRNNDPTQSIIIAGTGNGDQGNLNSAGSTDYFSKGVGFVRSMDGGATWTLLDSSTNIYDLTNDGGNHALDGQPLAYNSPLRDHVFIGDTTYKVVVDPKPGPGSPNNVIIYAALGGPTGGLWRSLDSGNHWFLLSSPASQGTTATDVLLAPDSASVSSGNLQRVYAAFQGFGVYMSLAQGQNMALMPGGIGNALIRDGDNSPATSILVQQFGTPNGAHGRITLATVGSVPGLAGALTGNAIHDLLYEGWLYAAVSNPDGTFNGLYVTKDAGANWTQIHLPFFQPTPATAFPTNDETRPDFNPTGTQGNYDLSLAVDPTNPQIVYLGGQLTELLPGAPLPPTGGLLRIDITQLHDAHNLTATNYDDPDGGLIGTIRGTDGSVLLKPSPPAGNNYGVIDQVPNGTGGFNEIFPGAPTGWTNLISDPFNPFLTNSTVLVTTTAMFRNDGSDVRWGSFDGDGQGDFTGDWHRMITMLDPLTGHNRLIIGSDNGVFSVVDQGNGQLITGLGDTAGGRAPVITGSRNGNLQTAEFYYGAVQPSVLSGEIAAAILGSGGLFYGNADDNGFPVSDPHTLTNGNLIWTGPPAFGVTHGSLGDGTGIAVDATGSGSAYSFQWPATGLFSFLSFTNFFVVNPTGTGYVARTGTGGTSLVQANNPGSVPDPQWPAIAAQVNNGHDLVQSNIAVNPFNPGGNQIVIGSAAGRLFRSRDQGRTWGVIANPSALDGSIITSLTYGAPDPANPSQNLDDFIFAGTANGKIFVTLDGGGVNGTDWTDISGTATDTSPIMSISANPTRGTHEIYIATMQNVFHETFNVTYPTNAPPVVSNLLGVKVTGNIFNITTNFSAPNNSLSFQLPHDSTKPVIQEEKPLQYITSLAVDWRFQIPNTTGGGVHPALYVGGEGGVFRSMNVDNFKGGVIWTVFPNVANDGAAVDGGYLPMSHVTDLHIAAGNINPTTGLPNQSTGPNMLVATTFGRGEFAIRLPNNSPFNKISGPQVLSLLPTQPARSSVSSVVVTFKGAVDPSSFTVASIPSFTGPNGAITPTGVVDVTPPSPAGTFAVQAFPGPTASSFAGPASLSSIDNAYNGLTITITSGADNGFSRQITTYTGATHVFTFATAWPIAPAAGDTFAFSQNLHNIYRVDFPTQTTAGAYTMVIGPNVTDFAGNQMDQDGNQINGEATDTFTGRFYTNTTPTGPFVSGIVGHELGGGGLWVATSNGINAFSNGFFGALAPTTSWVDVHTGDFNGDGKTDIAARNAQTGQWMVGISTGSTYSFSVWDTWSTAVTWVDVNVGNFSGNINPATGKPMTDITGRVLQSGDWWTAVSTGSSFNNSFWTHWNPNVTWADVRVGDFNGDGKTDIIGRVLQTGEWWVGLSTGTSFQSTLWDTWNPAANWTDVQAVSNV
jgi:subtilisin-like proprotein convertase family protein